MRTANADNHVIVAGRRLSYTAHGSPDGCPIVLLHGNPGSRLGWESADRPSRDRGVRLLCLDRPGFGRSDPRELHSFGELADDLTGFADTLGVDQFALIGHSLGAPYALACASRLPSRVSAVGVLAGSGPLDRPGSWESLAVSTRRLLDNSVRRPRLAQLMLASMAWSTRLMPALTLRGFVRNIGASDRQFLQAKGPSSMRPFAEGYRQGTRAGLADFRLWRQPWRFRLDEISVPVHLWHGDDDTFIGIDHSEHMAASISGASLHIVPDTGHFSIANHIGPALDSLMNGGPA